MTLIIVALVAKNSQYSLVGGIISIVLTSISFLVMQLGPVIYAFFWDPTALHGSDDLSVMRKAYLKILSLVLNFGSSVETLNYAIQV